MATFVANGEQWINLDYVESAAVQRNVSGQVETVTLTMYTREKIGCNGENARRVAEAIERNSGRAAD